MQNKKAKKNVVAACILLVCIMIISSLNAYFIDTENVVNTFKIDKIIQYQTFNVTYDKTNNYKHRYNMIFDEEGYIYFTGFQVCKSRFTGNFSNPQSYNNDQYFSVSATNATFSLSAATNNANDRMTTDRSKAMKWQWNEELGTFESINGKRVYYIFYNVYDPNKFALYFVRKDEYESDKTKYKVPDYGFEI